jgi:hypothetical protein
MVRAACGDDELGSVPFVADWVFADNYDASGKRKQKYGEPRTNPITWTGRSFPTFFSHPTVEPPGTRDAGRGGTGRRWVAECTGIRH